MLHRQMAQHTVAQGMALQSSLGNSLEVRFVGGDRTLMQTWLGSHLLYCEQGEGDLGDRMAQSVAAAFAAGARCVVVIGTDCPEVGAELLHQAFVALEQHDLVLGPATDGGYYLIGLRQPFPELFRQVAWGTEVVLSQTVAIAQALALTVAYLPPLTDVDRPDDLPIWHNLCQRTLSVIIPTLNEAHHIQATLATVPRSPTVEVIVVDGGSQDGTVAIAQRLGATVLTHPPGRAAQMNAGAALARGCTLLFLHADTRLPAGAIAAIEQHLAQPQVVAGAFELAIEGELAGLRLVEWGVRRRSHWLQLPYGDQGLFLKAATFHQVGGFPEQAIMEDFELVHRLKRLGTVAIAPLAVVTSDRRWRRLGIVRTTLLNQVMVMAYRMGISPQRLAQWYRRTPRAKKRA